MQLAGCAGLPACTGAQLASISNNGVLAVEVRLCLHILAPMQRSARPAAAIVGLPLLSLRADLAGSL
jgi:hypothetical protein